MAPIGGLGDRRPPPPPPQEKEKKKKKKKEDKEDKEEKKKKERKRNYEQSVASLYGGGWGGADGVVDENEIGKREKIETSINNGIIPYNIHVARHMTWQSGQ